MNAFFFVCFCSLLYIYYFDVCCPQIIDHSVVFFSTMVNLSRPPPSNTGPSIVSARGGPVHKATTTFGDPMRPVITACTHLLTCRDYNLFDTGDYTKAVYRE